MKHLPHHLARPTEQQFHDLIEKHPSLCAWGWWNPVQGKQMNIDLAADRYSLRLYFDEFCRSVDWLSRCQTTQNATRKSPTSYELKHLAERATGDYICNGAIIAAALYLRIPVNLFGDTPNPGIGISTACPVYQSAKR